MIWVLFIVIAVVVVGGFLAFVTGRAGYDPMAPATGSQSEPELREGFAAADVAAVRFDTALRGYRMDQVDAVLDRLQARIAELEAQAGATAAGWPAATDPEPAAPDRSTDLGWSTDS